MSDETSEPARSRRAILGAAAAGAVALTAGRVLGPDAAGAASGAMQYGADNDAGADGTTLASTNPFTTFVVTGSGAQALRGEGTGAETHGVVGIGSGPGTGVWGSADGGAGVHAQSASGQALRVTGRAALSSAGSVSVAKGKASVRVTHDDVRPTSLVLATIQRDRKDLYVRGVVLEDGAFRILLNRKVGASTKVAYLIVEANLPFPD